MNEAYRRIDKFFEHGWSIGNSELIPRSGPLLVACEHPPFPGLFPFLHNLKSIRPDMVIISDALLSFPIKTLLRIETIPLNAQDNVSWAKDITERRKMQVVRQVGNIIGVYKDDQTQSGKTVLNYALEELMIGKAVVIAPTGQNSHVADWKSGFGFLVKQALTIELDFSIAFVALDRRNHCKPTLLDCFSLGDLHDYGIEVDNTLSVKSFGSILNSGNQWAKLFAL